MSVGYKAKLNALLKEFPFISRYVEIVMLEGLPKISRVDLDVIDGLGHTKEWGLRMGLCGHGLAQSRNYFLLNKSGEEITKVTPYDVGVKPQEKLWGIFNRNKTIKTEGETVYEAVKKLSDPDQVSFVVEVENFILPRRTRISIYKVPARIPFSVWISRIKEIAESELSREISKIDTVE